MLRIEEIQAPEVLDSVGLPGRNLGAVATAEAIASGSLNFANQPSATNYFEIGDAYGAFPTTRFEFYANGGTYTGAHTGVEIGADVDATVTALRTAINAHVLVSRYVDGTDDLGNNKVLLAAEAAGTAGNYITLAKSGANLSVSAAALAGGAQLPTAELQNVICLGRLSTDGANVVRLVVYSRDGVTTPAWRCSLPLPTLASAVAYEATLAT